MDKLITKVIFCNLIYHKSLCDICKCFIWGITFAIEGRCISIYVLNYNVHVVIFFINSKNLVSVSSLSIRMKKNLVMIHLCIGWEFEDVKS